MCCAKKAAHSPFHSFTDLDSADIQLDTTLVEDKSDDDDESGDESDDDAESKPSARTIDLKFAVGNFNESPEMALLDRNGEEEGTEKQQEQANGRAGEKRPASLKQHNDSTNTTDASSCKKSKPLIQELS